MKLYDKYVTPLGDDDIIELNNVVDDIRELMRDHDYQGTSREFVDDLYNGFIEERKKRGLHNNILRLIRKRINRDVVAHKLENPDWVQPGEDES